MNSTNTVNQKPVPPNGSNWISKDSKIQSLKLGQISLPGTHHSNATTLSAIIAPGAQEVVASLFSAAGAGTEMFKDFSKGWKDLMKIPAESIVEKGKLDPLRPMEDEPLPSLVQAYIKGWSEPQHFSVTEQLKYGARYLDMRVCGALLKNEALDFYSHHMLLGGKLSLFLEEVAQFAESTTNELIVIEAAHMNFNFCLHQRFLRLVRSKIGHLLFCKPEGDDRALAEYTVGEIVKDGPKIVLLYDNENFNTYMRSNPKEFSDVWIYLDEVHDIYDGDSYATLDGLISYATQGIKGSLPKNKIVKLQWIMTPPGQSAFIKGLAPVRGEAHNLQQFSAGSAEALVSVIENNLTKHINVLFVDFFISESKAFELAMKRNELAFKT